MWTPVIPSNSTVCYIPERMTPVKDWLLRRLEEMRKLLPQELDFGDGLTGLQRPTVTDSHEPNEWWVWVDVTEFYWGQCLRPLSFTIAPLDGESQESELLIEWHPLLQEQVSWLVSRIHHAWPATKVDQPQKPKQAAGLRRWKAVWALIKPDVLNGLPVASASGLPSILGNLQQHETASDLKVHDPKTISQIIKAGQAGSLDD